jgi:hypothetical protein
MLAVSRRSRAGGRVPLIVVAVVLWTGIGSGGCKAKVSGAQCDQLLDRYAQLVVTEKYPDASVGQIEAERTRERSEARGDDAFKNCSSEVSRPEFDCAVKAASAEAFLKCLE